MLEEKHMLKRDWAEVVIVVVYLLNQTSVGGTQVTPHEAYFECKLNMAHIQVFDNITYVHMLKEKRMKLDAKAEKCILVGYSEE